MENYKYAFLFDVAKEGVYYEKIKLNSDQDFRYQTSLVKFGDGIKSLRRCHFIANESYHELDHLLKTNAASARSGKCVFLLGYRTDCFSNFELKFHQTKKFLETFAKYQPGKLIIQTYGQNIVLALPNLLAIKSLLTINVIIESPDSSYLHLYSPSKIAVEDRIKAAAALKNFMFDVEIQVAPLLPYRGGKVAAKRFAEELVRASNRIFAASFARCAGSKVDKTSPLANYLINADLGKWLRGGAAEELRLAIEKISPEHLEQPKIFSKEDKQLDLFVA